MNNILEIIVKELEKNGVKFVKPDFDVDKYEPSLMDLEAITMWEPLDFTEHDKVFEDKIAKLENENMNLRGNNIKTEDSVQVLKQRIAELENIINNKLGGWDKHGISYQEILDMKDENESLKKRIDELETKLDVKESLSQTDIDLSTPLACAESLIEHMTHCEKFMIMPERDVQTFSVEELKEIADYLMVYYRHNRDRDTEVQDFSF